MLSDFLSKKIIDKLPFVPTDEQNKLVESLSAFLMSHKSDEVYLLRGYAGTGKTSVMGALIQVMTDLKQKAILMAPTGRAAKVFSSYANHTAFTIHKKIYRQKSISDFHFVLAENLHKHTLFIVDEASMIANGGGHESIFGSGRLLDDLLTYVYSGEGCRLLIMGDSAQLPPVGQIESPALSTLFLEGYSLSVSHFSLTQVVRQSLKSGILHNATLIRQQIQETNLQKPQFELKGFSDIKQLSGEDLIETLNNEYSSTGLENCMVITRSNKRALIYNKGIRNQVLQKEDEISAGDLLMVVKNNYFWTKEHEKLDFIANGDIVEIIRVRRYIELYDLRFADVCLRFLDYDDEIDVRILLDSLHAETPADMDLLNKTLFNKVAEDYADIANKRDRMKAFRENEYYNALQVKFAYAVTCHKAQGGQWESIFVDQGFVGELSEDYFHWLYTALTRATRKLYLVNFPKDNFRE